MRRAGYSLFEVIMALVIFGFLATSITRGVLELRETAENAVYEATALTVATGFIEQVKSMPYNELEALAEGSASTMEFIIANGAREELENGSESTLSIPIDADESGQTTITMDFHVLINISPLADYDAVQADLLYGFEQPLSGRSRTSSITTIITDVPTF